MKLNRNHYFAAGVLLLLAGLQFRLVDSVVLNEHATQFVAQRFSNSQPGPAVSYGNSLFASAMPSRRTLKLPRWLGLSLLSVGSVLALHSLAMKKPGM